MALPDWSPVLSPAVPADPLDGRGGRDPRDPRDARAAEGSRLDRENAALRELVTVYRHLSGLALQDADLAGVVQLISSLHLTIRGGFAIHREQLPGDARRTIEPCGHRLDRCFVVAGNPVHRGARR